VRVSWSPSRQGGERDWKPGDTLARRDTTEGIPIAALALRKARQGGGLGHAGRTRGVRRKACASSASGRFWNRQGGARGGDDGCQRSGRAR
jgi:hypothetical protein